MNDLDGRHYREYGPAILLEKDRMLPVLHLGYQRCNEPLREGYYVPNQLTIRKGEPDPFVGGDVIVETRGGYMLPMFNTVVLNHARVSFINRLGPNDNTNAYVRTDLLRIRNHVEMFDGGDIGDLTRKGNLVLKTRAQMEVQSHAGQVGIDASHLHMEPNSELSLYTPDGDALRVASGTVIGGYGKIHKDVSIEQGATIAPGFASLMERDCQTPDETGRLTIHDLSMAAGAEMRISIRNDAYCMVPNPVTGILESRRCTQTDTLYVRDTVWMHGKIPLYVLPTTDYIDEGCYLFFEYDDTLDYRSFEYIKNLELQTLKYGDYYFSLRKELGKVYLCITTFPVPEIQRYILIEPNDEVTTNPISNFRHYRTHRNPFLFSATFSRAPLEVWSHGVYSGRVNLLSPTSSTGSTFNYGIYNILEPFVVRFGPPVSNEGVLSNRVWSYRNNLHVNVETADVVSIYTLTGILYRKVEVAAGTHSIPLEQGMYMVTLKDGTYHKITIN
jgi:hypothetical protein